MLTSEELIPTKAELAAARDAALAAVWAVFYVALALSRFAHQLGNPRESDWPYDDFGIEAENTFRRMIERRDALKELLPDRLLTALEEAKARAGDPIPVSVGDVRYPTYHAAAMDRLCRFVRMLSSGRPLPWPSWVTVLRGTYDVTGPANCAERYAYYDSLIEDLMSFSFVSNGEETEGGIQDERARALDMETGIRCEYARIRALAAAPDAENKPGVVDDPQAVKDGADAREIPDPVANWKLADLVEMAPGTVSKQIQAALHKAGKAVATGQRGIDRWWTRRELHDAYPKLARGDLRKLLKSSVWQTDRKPIKPIKPIA